MTWVAVGVGSAAVVGGLISSDASHSASNAQQASGDRAIQAQQSQANQTRADNAQFLRTGNAANQRLAQLLGLNKAPQTGPKAILRGNLAFDEQGNYLGRFGHGDAKGGTLEEIAPTWGVNSVVDESGNSVWDKPGGSPADQGAASDPNNSPLLRKMTQADIDADPVYQSGLKFGLDRGTEAVNSRALASGMYDSGATMKALTQFGNDYGSTKAADAYNRFTNDQNNTFNKLSGASGTGQVANSQVAASGTNAANNISQTIEGQGNARAAGIVGGANAWGAGVQGANNAANNYQSNARLDALLARSGGNGSTYPNGPSQPYYTGYGGNGDYQYG